MKFPIVFGSPASRPSVLLVVAIAAVGTPVSSRAQGYTFVTLVGAHGGPGSADATGAAARFYGPQGLALDNQGNLYVTDGGNHTVRRVTPLGVVTTIAGAVEQPGSADGTGGAARFGAPIGASIDSVGNLYVAEDSNYVVRKITPAGVVTTLAGSAGQAGSVDGTGSNARFDITSGTAVDGAGNVYVSDYGNNTIRKITPAGVVTTLAGSPRTPGTADGTGSAARFHSPYGMAADAAGNVYVADIGPHTIRKITPAGVVTTIAGSAGQSGSVDGTGSAARFNQPAAVALDAAGNLYVADLQNHQIRKITPAGVVSTVAGQAGRSGNEDGSAAGALFRGPAAVAVDATGNVFVADQGNHAIRRISAAGTVSTLAGLSSVGRADGTGRGAAFNNVNGGVIDPLGNLYVTDTSNHTVRKITPTGVVTTFVGQSPIPGDADGTGAAARFRNPSGIARDAAGNFYVADSYNHTVRKISPAGAVTTLAGLAGETGTTDGPGASARFEYPSGVAVDRTGNVFVCGNGHTIRKITPAGVVSTFAGQAGSAGSTDGTGPAARFNVPNGLTIDANDTLYVADLSNHTIRQITSAGVVTTIAGLAGSLGTADGTGASARFHHPWALAVDPAGNLFVVDGNNSTVRRIAPGGVVTTIGGVAKQPGAADGYASVARFRNPTGVVVDGAGAVYVMDASNNSVRKSVANNGAPILTTTPASQTVLLRSGGPVGTTFGVAAVGLEPVGYQWRKGGVNLSGATATTLTLPAVQASDAGGYDVVVSNTAGTVTSPLANLQVVSASAGDVVRIAAGLYHSLWLKQDGSLWATGYNGAGQLGDGTTTNRSSPVLVASGVVAMAAGGGFSAFVKSDGTLWTTGKNDFGQLGDGTTIDRSTPAQIATGVSMVDAGADHLAYVKNDGTLWSTGRNTLGQLGDGTNGNRSSPVQVAVGVAAVILGSGSNHTLFLKTDGSLWGMGQNAEGQLGDGTNTNRATPAQIATGVVSAAAGIRHSVFRKSDGSLWTMGGNPDGQLASGTNMAALTPVQVAAGVVAADAGDLHTVILKDDGSLWTVGYNEHGLLGDGANGSRAVPYPVASGVVWATAGGYHNVYRKSDGSVWAMGYNTFGQFGNGTQSSSPVPMLIIAAPAAPAISIQALSTVAGATGSSITIAGSGFSATPANNIVYFGAVRAAVTAANATALTVTVPVGSTYAPVSVTVAGITAESLLPFNAVGTAGRFIHAGSFSAAFSLAGASTITERVVADLDGDGKPDLVAANYTAGSVSVFRNASAAGALTDASFASRVDFTVGAYPHALAAVDLDGDGKLDLAVANLQASTVTLLRNTSTAGTVSFAAGVTFACGYGANGIAAGDLDGDGKLDLVTGNSEVNGTTLSLLRNQSSVGTFAFGTQEFSLGMNPYSLALGDLDGDGRLDLVVGGGTSANRVALYRNIAAAGSLTGASFESPVNLTTGNWNVGIALGDLDADGKLDLVVGHNGSADINSGNVVTVFRNQSASGTLASGNFTRFDFNSGSGVHGVSIGDVDNDTRPDLVVSGWGAGVVSVLRNTTPAGGVLSASSFLTRSDVMTVNRPYLPAVVDLDGDGLKDLVVDSYDSGSLWVSRNAATPPPVITAISAPRQVVTLGQSLTLGVTATGSPAPTYQWKRNGLPIAGATAATYTLSNASPVRDNGYYQVNVTNESGAATSAVAYVNVVVNSPQVIGFGSNGQGQTTTPAGLTNLQAIAVGDEFNLALKADGTVVGWGFNGFGQTTIPPGLGSVVAIAGGNHHSLALKADGSVVAWGNNEFGQATVPSGMSNVVAISCDGHYSLALKSDGTVVAWGRNEFGQTSVPAGLTGVVAIAAGATHGLALKSDGTVAAWGNNGSGQATVPAGLTGVVAIAAGDFHSLALKSDGTVLLFGSPGASISTIPAGLSGVVAIAGGATHSLALKADGTVVGWGIYDSTLITVPAGLSDVVAIGGGYRHSLVMRNAAGDTVPAITTQPIAQTAVAGTSATFSVVATGTPAPTFQWRKGGTNIAGATNANLTIASPQSGDAGDYDVVVTNSAGSATTNAVTLTVLPAGSVAIYAVTTLAGLAGSSDSVDGTGSAARFNIPFGVAVDGVGNVFVTDSANHTIRRVTTGGVVTTVAGTAGASGNLVGTGSAARFFWPSGVAVDGGGNVFVVDRGNNAIRKIAGGSVVTTFAGSAGGSGSADGTGSAAQFDNPYGVAIDGSGNLFVADYTNHTIRKITATGAVTTLAGSARSSGSADGVGSAARFNSPYGVAVDSSGTLFVTDKDNHTIRKITAGGVVTTLAGTAGLTGSEDGIGSAARFVHPSGVAVDGSGNVFVVSEHDTIRRITSSGVVTTLAGAASSPGSADGPASAARFTDPMGIAVDGGGNVFVADTGNHTIRKLTVSYVVPPVITTQPIAQTVVAGTSATFSVVATGTPAPTFQWRKGGTDIAGATNASFTIPSAQASDVGSYDVVVTNAAGSVTSNAATLVVAAPSVTATLAPAADTTIYGDGTTALANAKGVSFFAGRSGKNRTMRTLLRFDLAGQVPAGATVTEATLTLTVTSPRSHPLTVEFRRLAAAWGEGTSDASSGEGGGAPATPGDATWLSRIHGNATAAWTTPGGDFSATASATQSVPATTGNITVTSAALAADVQAWLANPSANHGWLLRAQDEAAAAARFSSREGTSPPSLRITYTAPAATAPVITTPPVAQTVAAGASVTFSVSATGAAPFTYQWRKNGIDIPGATAALLALGKARPDLAGAYSVVVTNSAGNVTSSAATLAVNAAVAGGIAAWGINDNGQRSVPVGLNNAVAIAGGDRHSLALRNDGTLVGWGTIDNGVSTPPAGLTGVSAIAAGFENSAALKSDGTVVVWGSSQTNLQQVPAGLTGVVAVSAGNGFAVALKSDGTVVAWGRTSNGVTTVPGGLLGVTAIASGMDHTVALKNDGTVVAWGSDSFGQTAVPAGLGNVVAIAAGGGHSLALKRDGTVVAWGANVYGQAVPPSGLSGVSAITVGGLCSLALKDDGTLVAWGHSGYGQTTIPAGLAAVSQIALGGYHALAIAGSIAPVISTQPVAQAVGLGQTATFSIGAAGAPAPTYQWRRNGTSLPGATDATLTLTNVQAANAGSYDVVVSNTAGSVTSSAVTLTLALAATPQSVSTNEDTVKAITLAGTDPGAAALTFAIASQPASGSVTLSGATATYTPAADFHGTDSFTFAVNNGTATSAPATVAITVAPINDPPVFAKKIHLWVGDYNSGTIYKHDATGAQVLSFSSGIFGHPTGIAYDGTNLLIGDSFELYNRVYKFSRTGVQLGFINLDNVSLPKIGSFEKKVLAWDGEFLWYSSSARFAVHKIKVNAWSAAAGSIEIVKSFDVPGGSPTGLEWDGTSLWLIDSLNRFYQVDPDGNTLTTFTYPRAASDLAWDGRHLWAHGGASYKIDSAGNALGSLPVYYWSGSGLAWEDGSQAVNEDAGAQTVAGWATATSSGPANESGQTLTFEVTNNNNALFAVPPSVSATGTLTYTPAPNAHGRALVTVRVRDNGGTAGGGADLSAPETFFLTVTPVNDAPVALAQAVSTDKAVAKAITLTGTDPDGGALTFAIATQPLHGTVSLNGATATYTPFSAWTGPDSFSFTASDGTLTSAAATVSITVTAPAAPVFTAQPMGQYVKVASGTSLTVEVTGLPAPALQWRRNGVNLAGATNATLTLTNVQISDAGAYSVVATNSAGSVTSAVATLTVARVFYYLNDASTANDMYATAAGSDANDGLTPGSPKASLVALLDAHDLEAGDMVLIDSGSYALAESIRIDGVDGGSETQPVIIRGSTHPVGTTFNLGGGSGNVITCLASDVTVEYMRLTGATTGAGFSPSDPSVTGSASRTRIRYSQLYGNMYGVHINWGPSGTVVQNCVIANNTAAGVYARSLGGTANNTQLISNSVFATNAHGFHFSVRTGPVTMRHNIISVRGSGKYAVFHDDAPGTVTSDYNDFFVQNGAEMAYWTVARPTLANWRAATGQDANSIAVDPLFFDPAGGDFHLKSQGGRYSPASGLFVADSVTSWAIDAGDPNSSVGSEPVPEGGRINLGAFGGTAEASKTPTGRRLQVIEPNGGESVAATAALRWAHQGTGITAGDTVLIEYSANAGQTWNSVTSGAAVVAANRTFAWDTTAAVPATGTRFLWRITMNQDASATDAADRAFTVRNTPVSYYVNDASTSNDVYTSATGSDLNDGGSPATPKATLTALLTERDLEPGDTVFVDTGTYALAAPVFLDVPDEGSLALPVTIRGSTHAMGSTLSLGGAGGDVIRSAASYLIIEYIRLTGATSGAGFAPYDGAVTGAGRGTTIRHSRLFGNQYGVWINWGPSDTRIQHCVIYGNTAAGVYARSVGNTATNTQIVNNSIVATNSHGVHLSTRTTSVVLRNNIFSVSGAEKYGINVDDSGISMTSDYNAFFVQNNAGVGQWVQAYATMAGWRTAHSQDTHSLEADPLFFDPTNADFHLKSQGGRFDPVTGSFTIDVVTSPAIDAGDPADPVGAEPTYNGNRINLGAYGGTSQASKTLPPPAGTVVAWGAGSTSTGSYPNFGQAIIPAGLSSVVAIKAGESHNVALKSDGTLTVWGRNDYGQSTVPVGLSGVTAIAAGAYHSAALKTDGTVVAWGRNENGQTSVPAGLNGVTAISAGYYHTLALKNDGTVIAWGKNEFGETTVPAGLNAVMAIAAGGFHNLALKFDGTVVAWGLNENGQTTVPTAAQSGVISIAAGRSHSVALRTDRSVVAWGKNDVGQATVPSGLSGVVGIAAGGTHTAVIKNDGMVAVWGGNDAGQSTVPVGLSGVTAVAAGERHTVALIGSVVSSPEITTQPQAQTVTAGSGATFSVSASGTAPLAYQWRKNTTPIPGATGPGYTIASVQAADAGSYDVVVTNSAGSVTSGAAVLTVVEPAFAAGNLDQVADRSTDVGKSEFGGPKELLRAAGFRTGAASGRLASITLRAEAANPQSLSGFTLALYSGMTAGGPTGLVAEMVGPAVHFSDGTYTYTPATPTTLAANTTYWFVASAPGVPAGNNFFVLKSTTSLADTAGAIPGWIVQDTHWLTTNGGGSWAEDGSAILLFAVAVFPVEPAIATPPQAQVANVGSSATFTVGATGAPAPTYQWRKGTVPIPGATGASLVIPNVQPADAGSYDVVVTNRLGSATSTAASLTVNQPTLITRQPAGSTVVTGATATVSVEATGTAPLTYQWYEGAAGATTLPVGGATAASFTTPVLTATKSYWVRVSGPGGAVDSAAATITVATFVPTVALSVDGPAHYLTTGGTVTLRVRITYTGELPAALGVRVDVPAGWSLAATGGPNMPQVAPLAGTTNPLEWGYTAVPAGQAEFTATLTVPAGNTGAKTLTGSVNYRPGDLNVALPAVTLPGVTPIVITTPPQNLSIDVGRPVTLSVVATGDPAPAYQWRKSSQAIAGATTPSLYIAAAAMADAGFYDVVVSNGVSATVTSATVLLRVIPAGLAFTHRAVGGGYTTQNRVTISNTITYTGTATALGWKVLLPAGWSFVSDGGSAGDSKPAPGTTGLLEWAWTTSPPSPVTFTYTLAKPDGVSGDIDLAAPVVVRLEGFSWNFELMAKPDPLVLRPVTFHSADTDRNFRISLVELTRVIELYNTRHGTTRTGRYKVQAGTEDGFAPDPDATTNQVLAIYHSADTDRPFSAPPETRDGRIGLVELTRVIEIYNARAGTVRTGAYHAVLPPADPTEDGYAPGL